METAKKASRKNYQNYRLQIAVEDAHALNKFAHKLSWKYFIPLFGFIYFIYVVEVFLGDCDRHLLRKNVIIRSWELWKRTVFIGFFLVMLFSLIINIYAIIYLRQVLLVASQRTIKEISALQREQHLK